MTYVKPFLKWVGGKSQILPKVLDLFPKTITNYHEPFVGGGSVLLGLLSCIQEGTLTVSGKIYASDINEHLIHLYKHIQSVPEQVIDAVERIAGVFHSIHGTVVCRKPTTLEDALTSQESYYYWMRSTFNALSVEERATPEASAMFLFLNKTCFRGIYRESSNGFNVPYGNYKHPTIIDKTHIRHVSQLIKEVVFTACSFTEACMRAIPGDFVYLDPPYAPETSRSFVSYTSDGFTMETHTNLFQHCHTMQSNGTRFLLSNADVSLVKNAFPATIYKTLVLECRRKINSKNPASMTNEVLIWNP